MEAASASRGSTFSAHCPVGVMASQGSTAAPSEIDALFESFVTGLRGETLRAQLAAKHPERTREEIDDAIQTACKCFIDETPGIIAPGQVYRWIRTVAHRALNREREHLKRQVPVDPSGHGLDAIAADFSTPEQLVIEREDKVDLATLTETVASTLADRQRDVLALYGAGYKRPQIADRLDVSERAVKRDLLEIVDRARAALARLTGGGCDRGESLVVRLACGLATPTEASQAQLHLARCGRCQQFHERLNLWREKVGALLPIPASEHNDPGVLERTLHKTVESLGSLRQHLADGGAQIKQQATATYVRAADPTPLAGARPGAVAAVVAGCLAVGTGTYTCVEQGINPLTSLPGLGERAPEQRAANPPPPEKTEQAPAPTPVAPVAVEPTPAPEPAPTPAPTPEPVEPAPQPPPEQSFEPSSPAYSPPAAQPSSTPSTPAAVADGGGSSEFEP
jgi:DNA-directed RNA polymerase specialized sigma24 family protein